MLGGGGKVQGLKPLQVNDIHCTTILIYVHLIFGLQLALHCQQLSKEHIGLTFAVYESNATHALALSSESAS